MKGTNSNGVQRLSPERLKGYLALRDLTDPSLGVHAINMVLDEIISTAEAWSGLAAEVRRPSPIVTIQDNYDRLYYEPDAVARSARYSHYVDDEHILRTHTSAAIPSILREYVEERLIVVPGLVYRRDVMDRMHVGEPHQVDLWVVREGVTTRAGLLDMIRWIVRDLMPGCEYRCNETTHPYTVGGLEVEVLVGDRWVEVLECGLIRPEVLSDAGIDPRQWGGHAMGLGLDRLVMLRKGMDDIRLLRSTDPRVSRQMADLGPYEAVSNQPATRRDMSVCVSDPDMEIIGDRIRAVLGERAEWVEEIVLVSQTPYGEVPEKARERLGMKVHQTNLLIRLMLCSPTESIPREVGNTIYEIVYRELHENSAGYV